ncbi:MAG: RluA family pseudouridine synthase [Verrucomicrobia bacterium]|nr:RluA family pseudouridine synthase [Verrucomicrobiota bacterium]
MSSFGTVHQASVPADQAGGRLDQFLCGLFPSHSRSQLQEWVRVGAVLMDGSVPAKPGVKLRGGERLVITEPKPEPLAARPEALPLEILFEDAHLLVLNKAAGMVVHPAVGNWSGTVVNALLHHCEDLSGEGGDERPGIVHRLDKETSGCLVVAKNDVAHRSLSSQFAGREVVKIYLAVAIGRFKENKGSVQEPIGRHPVHRQKMSVVAAERGRAARTDWEVLAEIEIKGLAFSVVQCRLFTGRTHQIRVHMAHLGHGLLGDSVYGRKMFVERQMLHAWQLGFSHPETGAWMQFTSPLPEDFRSLGVLIEGPQLPRRTP